MAPKQSRAFCFTLNNPTRYDFPKDWFQAKDVVYVVWQVEKGESGTEHLQGYLVTKENPKSKAGFTVKWCKDNLSGKAHFEVRAGTHAQARDYCKKDDTRRQVTIRNALGQPAHGASFDGSFGPWELGQWKDQETTRAEVGERAKKVSLLDVKASIDAGATDAMLWDKHFSAMTRHSASFKAYQLTKQVGERRQPYIILYWGEPGCGKSMKAKEVADKNGGAFWYSSYASNWWDGYNPSQHNVVVLDDFKGNIPHKMLLRMLDRYPLQVEVKGSTVAFNPAIIILTSNDPPNQWYFQDQINYDHSALLRRFDEPFGKIVEMKKDPNYTQAANYNGMPSINDIFADIESGALFNGLEDEVNQAAKAIIDLTDEDFVEDDEEAIALAEQASMAASDYPDDYYDFDEDPDLGEGAQPGGAVSVTADLERDWEARGAEASPRFISARHMLRRTDSSSLVFNTPSDRGPFKKLGTGKVQTELSWAKPAPDKRRKIMVSMANHDDDGDE